MAETKRTRIKVGANEYVVNDVRRGPGERTRSALIGRSYPAREVTFRTRGGAPRVPPLVSREEADRKSPIQVSQLTDEEAEARRRDQVRNDIVRGVATGFLAERAYAFARPGVTIFRQRVAENRGKTFKPPKYAPSIGSQLAARQQKGAQRFTDKQLATIARQDPIIRRLPATQSRKRWIAQQTGVLNYQGPKIRAKRIGAGFAGGLALGAGIAGARYANSRRKNRPEYSFKFGHPGGRTVKEVPLG